MDKVLVIDDDHDILDLVKLILTRKGIDVIVSSEPGVVKETIKTNNPNLLLMDISMGTFDGRYLCSQLKKDPEFSFLPVILFSANKIDLHSITESGADDFLQKPFDINSLVDIINAHLPVMK